MIPVRTLRSSSFSWAVFHLSAWSWSVSDRRIFVYSYLFGLRICKRVLVREIQKNSETQLRGDCFVYLYCLCSKSKVTYFCIFTIKDFSNLDIKKKKNIDWADTTHVIPCRQSQPSKRVLNSLNFIKRKKEERVIGRGDGQRIPPRGPHPAPKYLSCEREIKLLCVRKSRNARDHK